MQSLPLFVTKDGISAQKRHGNWKAYVGLPVSQKRGQADLDTQGTDTDTDTGTDTDTNIYSVKSTRQDTSATRSVLFLNHTRRDRSWCIRPRVLGAVSRRNLFLTQSSWVHRLVPHNRKGNGKVSVCSANQVCLYEAGAGWG